MTWDRVEQAVDEAAAMYKDLHEARETHQAGTKAIDLAYANWEATLNERAAALLEQWDEEKDGFAIGDPDAPSLARVLQRYYAEMLPVWKQRAKEAEAAAKAAKKEAHESDS